MRFLFFLIITFPLLINNLNAQDCGSHATYEDFLREQQNKDIYSSGRISATTPSGTFVFPLKFHLLRRSDGTGGPDYELFKNSFDTLSQKFATINVAFDTVCNPPSYINNSTYYNFSNAQETSLGATYDVPNAINLYIVDSLLFNGTLDCGYSHISATPSAPRLFVSQRCLGYNTMTHEMGHYFSLYHTFETYFGVEDPQESNCSYAGDLLCDTPADPNGSVNKYCQYQGPFTENYQGRIDPVHPLVNNIMSYYKTYGIDCRTEFTSDQYARMSSWAYSNTNSYYCPQVSAQIYPVPTENYLTVSLSYIESPLEFRVIDMIGKILYNYTLTSAVSQVDLTNLPSGVYIAQVLDYNHKKITAKKIIKLAANP